MSKDTIPGGNASLETKQVLLRTFDLFANYGFGTRTAQRLDLVEVSVVPNVDEPAKQEARVVLEMTVSEDMLNPAGKLHSACIAHLVDVCTTCPIVAMSFASGGDGSPGVSQSINIIYHAPAGPGDKLRLINTSMAMSSRAWSGRIEIWNVTHHRLVASATQVKMERSASKL